MLTVSVTFSYFTVFSLYELLSPVLVLGEMFTLFQPGPSSGRAAVLQESFELAYSVLMLVQMLNE